LQGQIESFDQFVVLLKNTVSQMVYKHAISTVVPSRNVRVPASHFDSMEHGDDAGLEAEPEEVGADLDEPQPPFYEREPGNS